MSPTLKGGNNLLSLILKGGEWEASLVFWDREVITKIRPSTVFFCVKIGWYLQEGKIRLDIKERFLAAGMVKQRTACQGIRRNLVDGNLKNRVRSLLFGGCLQTDHPASSLGLAWYLALLLSSLFTWLRPTARSGKHIHSAAERLLCNTGEVSMQHTFLAGS